MGVVVFILFATFFFLKKVTKQELSHPLVKFYSQEEVAGLDLYHDKPTRRVGERMAASYVNFYIANKAVIVPQFGCCPEADENALVVLRKIFEPERTVVGVLSKEVLLGGGNIHCITQQLPKAINIEVRDAN